MALLRNNRIGPKGEIIKSIALDPKTMKPRAVLKAVRSGDESDRCTQQEISKDDIVIMSTITDTITLDVLVVSKVTRYKSYMSKLDTSDNKSNTSEPLNWLGLFATVDQVLLEWLENTNNSPMLPANYGWDGKRTRYEQAKYSEFTELFKEVTIDNKDEFIEWAMVSPRENVNHQWNTSQAIPRDPLFLPPSKNTVSHFTVLWTDFGVDFKIYDDKDYSNESLELDTLQNSAVIKAIVGTIISNRYGNNVRWKLYS